MLEHKSSGGRDAAGRHQALLKTSEFSALKNAKNAYGHGSIPAKKVKNAHVKYILPFTTFVSDKDVLILEISQLHTNRRRTE